MISHPALSHICLYGEYGEWNFALVEKGESAAIHTQRVSEYWSYSKTERQENETLHTQENVGDETLKLRKSG